MSDKAINEWTAEKCGMAELDDDGYSEGLEWEDELYKWNFRDPRCMAKIRERLKIDTVYAHDDICIELDTVKKGYWYSRILGTVDAVASFPNEAEQLCVIKLYEAEHE